MGWRKSFLSVALSAAFVPAAAFAQFDEEPVIEIEEEQQAQIVDIDEPAFEVGLNGGVGGYTGDLGAVTGIGPVWGVQLDTQPSEFIGTEFSYVGSTHTTTLGIDDGMVWRNGVHGLAKLSLPLEVVDPFVGAGIGGSIINPTGNVEDRIEGANDIGGADLVGEVPVAAGVEFELGAIEAGLRGTYNILFSDDVGGGGNLLTGSATIGGQF